MDLQVKVCESSSSTQEDQPRVPDSFRRPRFHAVWRPMASDFLACQINALRRGSYVHDVRARSRSFPTRKQRMALRRRIREQQQNKQPPWPEPVIPSWVAAFAQPSVLDCSVIPAAEQSFQNYQKIMTTIKEETFLPKPSSRHNPIKKPKDLEDKVAALQLVVSRLHKLCLEKPEAAAGSISEETIQQFKEIRL